MTKKIIFTGLGPDRNYIIDEKTFVDGDIAEVDENMYNVVVTKSHYAQDWTPELEVRILKSLKVAEEKRKEVLRKMEIMMSKGGM